jgi:hypothetical protein
MTDPSKRHRCEDCPVRKKAEARPRSLIGIVWKLHTYICPGWKAYQRSLKREVM